MRKYVRYVIALEDETIESENYRESLSMYCKAGSATLYGVSYEGEMSVVKSK